MKKNSFTMAVMVLLLIAAGTAEAAVPQLVGTWTGTGKAVSLEHGYYNLTYTVNITNQSGNLFRGSIKIGTPVGAATQKFTGYIKADNLIYVNYRDSGGRMLTEALAFGKYIPPTATQPKPKYEGHWVNLESQDTGTMSLVKK
ncbi:hypothetical protein D4R89_01565 [bacterium]|nr:MAG: hypothetical protein D4R89_01565 [bacterium]